MHYKTNHMREQFAAAQWQSGRSRVPEGQFDPDELTRRLYVVIAERKAHAERKQRTRAELASRKDGQGPSSNTRHRNGAGPARDARAKPAEPSADIITELRRCESAKHKPSQPASDDAAAQAEAYHHVPQEAAKQFTRTTTVESMRNSDLVHKLSKRALKFHTEGPRAARPGGSNAGGGSSNNETAISPAELARALQRTQSHRDKLLERNQFQRTRTLDEAARLDHGKHQQSPLSPRKHTFESELARILPGGEGGGSHHNQVKHPRRNSTGDTTASTTTTNDQIHPTNRHSLLSPTDLRTLALDPLLEDTETPPPENLSRFPPADRARTDWTQSDESSRGGGGGGRPGSGPKPRLLLLTPLLRKADSLWALKKGKDGLRRGSKDSFGSSTGSGSGSAQQEGSGSGEQELPTAVAGKVKGGFFARFKR